jgi:Family of unknown function (DUF6008)
VNHMGHMSQSAANWDVAGAILLLLFALVMWTAVGILAYANRGPVKRWVFYGSIGVIALGVVGQIGHFQEHVAQAGYWLAHPNAQPWMTPWATGLANGFGRVDTSKPALGMEILHLIGNFIFLAGLAGVVVITRRAPQTRTRVWGRMGVWMQGIHGLEHLALTVSVALGASQAIGLSTWFGLIDPGPGLWTFRIWWHLIANAIGTMIFAMALYHLWRERTTIDAAYQTSTLVAADKSPDRSRPPRGRAALPRRTPVVARTHAEPARAATATIERIPT